MSPGMSLSLDPVSMAYICAEIKENTRASKYISLILCDQTAFELMSKWSTSTDNGISHINARNKERDW